MTEYLDRDLVIENVIDQMKHSSGELAMRERILNLFSADVAPVRHGRWIKTVGENGVTSACRCSLCGFEDNRYSLFNYCPNCGAKMDGDNG